MEDMKLREKYKETFAEIHASEDLAIKLQTKTKTKDVLQVQEKSVILTQKFIGWRRIATLATIFVLLIAFSNGIAYAATGNTWVKSIVVSLNGTNYSVDMNVEEGDGYILSQGWVMGDNGPVAVTIVNDKDDREAVQDVIMHIYMSDTEIIEQEGKIFFKDGDVKIDITEDATDGNASGVYQIDNIMKQYKAEYTEEGWNVSISEYPCEN